MPNLFNHRRLASTMLIKSSQVCQYALLERTDAAEGCIRRPRQQTQHCAATLVPAQRMQVPCPASRSLGVCTLTPYLLRNAWRRAVQQTAASTGLPPALQHRS